MTEITVARQASQDEYFAASDITRPVTLPAERAPRRGLSRWLEPASTVPTYVGVVVIAVGFSLIGVAWAEIAALTNVALQMPYLVSAGITGLALVMVGLIIVNIAAKRQDGAERAQQLESLTDALQQLEATIAHLDPDRTESAPLNHDRQP